MKIAIACDHAGFDLKEEVKKLLEQQGHEVIDFGTKSTEACDLPDTVYPAALAVARGQAERGIFIDGVGYGSAMIANRILGLNAAVCQDPFCAMLARAHSNTNVLCLGAKIIGSAIAVETIRVWMSTGFLTDEKYQRRVGKVDDIAHRHLKPLEEI